MKYFFGALFGASQEATSTGYGHRTCRSNILTGFGKSDVDDELGKSMKFASPRPGTRLVSNSWVTGARIVTSFWLRSACAHAKRCLPSASDLVTSPTVFFQGSGGAVRTDSGG